MNVLVACEFSGVVRRAFRELGHNAWSCDLLPAEDESEYHITTLAENIITEWWMSDLGVKWDLMIAHPPCTYLCSSGLHWNKRRPERQGLTNTAADFFLQLARAPIEKIAIENPIGCMSTRFRKPDQIIQPWMFGHPESKATCLWLKNLPKLQPTNVLPKPECGYWTNQTPSGQNKLGPSPKRAIERSRTYEGIAAAMAHQWGSI